MRMGIRRRIWRVSRRGWEDEPWVWGFRQGKEGREVNLFLLDHYHAVSHVREGRCRRQWVQRGQRNRGRRCRRPLPIPLLLPFILLIPLFSLNPGFLLPLPFIHLHLPALPPFYDLLIRPSPSPHPPHSRLPRRLQRPSGLLEVVLEDERLNLRCEFVEEGVCRAKADGLRAREGGVVWC